MKPWISKDGYHLGEDTADLVCGKYNAVPMGYWCTQRPSGGWNERPVDVFYVKNPDREKGHTNYFGLFVDVSTGKLMICNAETAFSEPIYGFMADDGEVIVSRYRHDYQQRKGVMVDGGRDYFRAAGDGHKFVTVTVDGPDFIFNVEK